MTSSIIKRLLCIFFSSMQFLFSQSHFIPVEASGLPYQIIITDIKIAGQDVPVGTEIGIFDDTLCVGAGIYEGTYSFNIVTWEGNPQNNIAGFRFGDTISYKIWINLDNNWREINMNPIYITGDGTFGNGVYSAVKLELNPAGILTDLFPEKFRLISTYPNPFNSYVCFKLKTSETEKITLSVFSIDGKMCFNKEYRAFPGNLIIQWDGKDNKNNDLPTGMYIIKFNQMNYITTGKILLLK